MNDIRLAAAMMRSVVGDKNGNIARLKALALEAADVKADILILPEACLTGYTVRESMSAWAEPLDGPLVNEVLRISRRFSLVILAGLIESSAEGDLYITQVMVAPEGVVSAYRKTHLGPMETKRFTPGRRLGVFNRKGATYGVQLCYEGHFPEMSLGQALAGADVILIPHASPREDPQTKLDRWLRYLPARAYDNTVFLAAVNQAGDNGAGLQFSGVALILGPKGEILAEKTGDGNALIYADLKAEALNSVRNGRMGYFLPIRRPEIYGLNDE